jgi:hypothetical protein
MNKLDLFNKEVEGTVISVSATGLKATPQDRRHAE